ncbi:uncharacterized protein LOC105641106 isoform X1 [Jatropha curcas]|uniref:uncharacterized protein LOC105641106 isoform X1 n=1 Tax=Jatropha curcas TaxID=180498 RepID=UPI0009D6515C|nr:uncharacterized protein LOC105641106 isoform X1 [Jatropha curcas]
MAFALQFSSIRCLKSFAALVPSVSPNPFVVSHVSTVAAAAASSSSPFFLSLKDTTHQLKLNHLSRASPEGIPSELVEDSKFVPLNAEDPVYGPPALLLLGFELDEAEKIRQLLSDLGGEFLQVIFCTENMIPQSLWEAMHTSQPNLEKVQVEFLICFLFSIFDMFIYLHLVGIFIRRNNLKSHVTKIAKSLPRICFLSGLSGEEMMMFIDAFPETGLEPAVFAALVPNSANKPLQELIEEIMGDHEMLTGKQQDST